MKLTAWPTLKRIWRYILTLSVLQKAKLSSLVLYLPMLECWVGHGGGVDQGNQMVWEPGVWTPHWVSQPKQTKCHQLIHRTFGSQFIFSIRLKTFHFKKCVYLKISVNYYKLQEISNFCHKTFLLLNFSWSLSVFKTDALLVYSSRFLSIWYFFSIVLFFVHSWIFFN